MENNAPLLPSPQLLSPPRFPTSGFDYFHQSQEEPEKRVHFAQIDKTEPWQYSSDDTDENARHAYLTPDPSSQIGFSSPPQTRRPLSSIPILRPKISGDAITIGRSSVQCTHPIPQQWLNMHISRIHVVIAYIPASHEISIECRGINPVIINTSYETHRLNKNDELRFKKGEDIKINISGYVVIVEAPQTSIEDSAPTSLPTLSPPIPTITYTEPQKRPQSSVEDQLDIRSLSPLPEQPQGWPFPRQQDEEIQIYHDTSDSPPRLSSSPAPEKLPPLEPPSPFDETQSQSAELSDSTVLDAILTSLIFAEVKPTPLPRVLSDLSHRLPNVQHDRIKAILTTTSCIGIVHRKGKDAAGKVLSDEYYYIAENDDNKARRERYTQFSRPTRSCRLKHSQYHWKPVKLHPYKSKSTPSSPGKENVSNGERRKRVKREPITAEV